MFDLHHRITSEFEGLPRRLQVVARWVLEHPKDVALLSTREQARRAGVPPATMTRFAQRLGFPGHDAIRQAHAEQVRRQDFAGDFSERAKAMAARRRTRGESGLAQEMIDTMASDVTSLGGAEKLEAITAAVRVLAKASHVFCLGMRSSFAIAFHFHYVRSFAGGATTLVDAAGGTGIDLLRNAGRGDALLAVGVRPYTRVTIDYARYAAQRGVAVVALTDSPLSPLARLAKKTIVVATESSSFFHAMTAAFAVAEVLAGLLAAHGGSRALNAIARTDRELQAVGAYATAPLAIGGRKASYR
jgi:DNA-binding MurR/RpiR family transcriptional regulator